MLDGLYYHLVICYVSHIVHGYIFA